MLPGDKVRLIANPGRVGILGNETDGPTHRLRVLVNFLDGDEQFVLSGSLEKIGKAASGPYELMAAGRYGRASDLRGAITYYRLSGKLDDADYDRISVAYGLSRFEVGKVIKAIPLPKVAIEPVDTWRDNYVGKDQC